MQSSQFGRVILFIFVVGLILMGISYFLRSKYNLSKQLFLHIFIIITLFVLFILAYNLTIFVNKDNVSFKFGPGVIEKSFPMEKIKSCKVVENKRRYGYGIRRLKDSWLYNVSGLKAVELDFVGKDLKVRIGTQNPEQICEQIDKIKGENEKIEK